MEDHADAAAEFLEVDVAAVDVDVMDEDRAVGEVGTVDAVVDTVETAEERGFTATGGADEGGDLAGRNVHGHIMEDLFAMISKREVLDLNGGVHAYHLSLARSLARRIIEPSERTATSTRKTKTEPYCARWVNSELGMRAARV